jgi:transcriptional regulator with XRE-family HTH domain
MLMNHIRLGTNLKALLRARGLSLKKISAQTGIPYSTLHTWLENRQPKDIVKVKILAAYLGVGLHYLLFGENEKVAGAPAAELPRKDGDDWTGIYEVIIRRRE